MREFIQPIADQIVVFTLNDQYYGLPLNIVHRVIHAVEIRFLPKAPEIISGIINVKGQIIPVINVRKRFGLEEREIALDDRLIIADTGKRQVALVADSVPGLRRLLPGQQIQPGESLPFAEYLKGVAKTVDGLILIYDLDNFLSLDEENELGRAIKSEIR